MNYTKEFLESQTIYFLRCIGYEVGVKAPTSKKRDELIKCILEVQNGETTPYFSPKAEKGYAFVNKLENDDALYCGDLTDEDAFYEYKPHHNGPKMTFDNDVLIFRDSRRGLDLNERIVSGYYYENGNSQNSIVSYENPMVLEKLANLPYGLKYASHIKIGNYVKAIVSQDKIKFPYAIKILEIEGQPAKNFSVEEFELKKVNFCKQVYFTMGDIEINYGDRILYTGNKHSLLNNILKLVTKKYNYCESIVFLAPKITPEKVNVLQAEENIELFHTLFSDSIQTLYFTYKLAVEHAKRLAELGKRVILVMSDIDALFEGVNVDINKQNESLRSLFGLARTFETEGSLTVIGVCSNDFYNEHNDFKNYIDVHFNEAEDGSWETENLNILRFEK